MKAFRVFLFAFVIFISLVHHASADVIGDNQSFFISSQYDEKGRSEITATLQNVSEKAYFYVEDSYWSGLSVLGRQQVMIYVNDIAREFDTQIYPKEMGFFGSEPNPGIDSDPRLTI